MSSGFMVHGLNSFDQLIEELSMIEYDGGKRFDPKRVEFVQCDGPGSFRTIIQDSQPFPKLRQAYDERSDVRVADFYGSELIFGVSFADGMRLYGLSGGAYLGKRSSEIVRVQIPLAVVTGR